MQCDRFLNNGGKNGNEQLSALYGTVPYNAIIKF